MNGDRRGETEPASLTATITRADRAALAAFVRENVGRLSESDLLRCLRHPYSGEAVVAEVLASPAALSSREVRKAVALHPAAPRADALRLLEDLTWRDLVDVGRETRTPAPVRHAANRRVLERLPKLSRGEKTALARLADRPLAGPLLDDGEVDVLAALLGNPRLVEEDLTAWLLVRRPSEAQLTLLSRSERWMERTAVRTALLLSPRTPRAIALSLLTSSERPVWERLAQDPSADSLLAACARSLLAGERPGAD
ncbi:MAG: hypothetical protein U0529_12530 [Thermoanaerobaculia bacterium]